MALPMVAVMVIETAESKDGLRVVLMVVGKAASRAGSTVASKAGLRVFD
jgi:hypothetical protein